MSTVAPLRARQSYRHEAFLWQGRPEYVEGLVPFAVEGLDAGEAVLALVTPEHARWIHDELGPRASEVQVVDMVELGRNPARILPALQEFLEHECGQGRPARAFGDPVWPRQGPEQLGEMQLNEALVNLAVDPDLPFWLICAYDLDQVDERLLADVACSHPVIATPTSYAGSVGYRGHEHARRLFSEELPVLEPPDEEVWVGERTLDLAAEQVTLRAAESNLPSDRVVALTDVVRGLVAGSLERGAGEARVQLWDEPEALVCEVADPMVIDDLLIGRRLPAQGLRDPVWLANLVCDLVEVRSGQAGTSVRMRLRK